MSLYDYLATTRFVAHAGMVCIAMIVLWVVGTAVYDFRRHVRDRRNREVQGLMTDTCHNVRVYIQKRMFTAAHPKGQYITVMLRQADNGYLRIIVLKNTVEIAALSQHRPRRGAPMLCLHTSAVHQIVNVQDQYAELNASGFKRLEEWLCAYLLLHLD